MNMTIEQYNSESSMTHIPASFNQFMKLMNNIKQDIPAEFLDSAEVDLFAREDSGFCNIKVTYERPESVEESRKRHAIKVEPIIFPPTAGQAAITLLRF